MINTLNQLNTYRGENATKDFLNNLLKESDEIEKILKNKFQ